MILSSNIWWIQKSPRQMFNLFRLNSTNTTKMFFYLANQIIFHGFWCSVIYIELLNNFSKFNTIDERGTSLRSQTRNKQKSFFSHVIVVSIQLPVYHTFANLSQTNNYRHFVPSWATGDNRICSWNGLQRTMTTLSCDMYPYNVKTLRQITLLWKRFCQMIFSGFLHIFLYI